MSSLKHALTYALFVTQSPQEGVSAQHAYQFAQALIEKGHKIQRIFFYHSGVLNALNSATIPNDEFDLTLAWQQLAKAHQFELHACVSASTRRGVDEATLADGFELAGLGSLATAMLECDRVIQF